MFPFIARVKLSCHFHLLMVAVQHAGLCARNISFLWWHATEVSRIKAHR